MPTPPEPGPRKKPAVAGRHFDNDSHWVELAHDRHIRLPKYDTPLATGPMERWLKKLGVSNSEYREWTGNQSKKAFIASNQRWTLRAWVGLLLEFVTERETKSALLEAA